jgi:hypothetical protein
MKALSNLIFKVTLSSMILTAPAMITGGKKDAGYGSPGKQEDNLPYYSSAVVKKFVGYTIASTPLYSEKPELMSTGNLTSTLNTERVVNTMNAGSTLSAGKTNKKGRAAAIRAETAMVINEAVSIYTTMDLEQAGLDEKAFEYAWRGYHNLLKKGLIRKKNVLSICDFSQSSCSKRLYVIDVRRRKLLYHTYVAHGKNSGDEYASSFSNSPESYKSSLGFYVTSKTYWGRNGLSLKIEGLDSGYNDLARKRNIVLHGSSYASLKYMRNYGELGTSLGCPAIPNTVSRRIIRAVKNGSCLFIYHPTKKYLDESAVINDWRVG